MAERETKAKWQSEYFVGVPGSDRGADRAAIMLTLIMTARLNDVDPKAWLADILARIADLPISRLPELLPWEWKRLRQGESPALMLAA